MVEVSWRNFNLTKSYHENFQMPYMKVFQILTSLNVFILIGSNIFLVLIINKIESYKHKVLGLCKEIDLIDAKSNLEKSFTFNKTKE